MKDFLQFIGFIALVYFICDPHGCAGCAQQYKEAIVSVVKGQ